MAEEEQLEEQEGQTVDTPPQSGVPQGDITDWKAVARKWEQRAKANKDAVDALNEAQKQIEELQDAASVATANAEEAQKALEHLQAVNAVAAEKGVPANLLKGDTTEELEASADELLKFIESQKPKFPQDKGGSAGSKSVDPASIKDPVARVHARAELFKSQM